MCLVGTFYANFCSVFSFLLLQLLYYNFYPVHDFLYEYNNNNENINDDKVDDDDDY